MKLANGKVLDQCPHCGFDEYCVSVRMSGCGAYFRKFDGGSGDNTNLHDSLKYKEGRTVYCGSCRKRLGIIERP